MASSATKPPIGSEVALNEVSTCLTSFLTEMKLKDKVMIADIARKRIILVFIKVVFLII